MILYHLCGVLFSSFLLSFSFSLITRCLRLLFVSVPFCLWEMSEENKRKCWQNSLKFKLLVTFSPYRETKEERRKFYKENKKTITREIVLIREGKVESREESKFP